MASTPEMLRIIRHAADQLDAQDPAVNGRLAIEDRYSATPKDAKLRAWQRATGEQVAISYASAVLRMVAACMDDEPSPEPKPEPKRGSDGRFVKAGES